MGTRRHLVVLGLAAVLTTAGRAWAAPVVAIDLASPITVGATVNAAVNISGIADLYAFQVDVAFNPAVVAAAAVTEGPFLSNAGPTWFPGGTIDNLAGTVSFISGTLLGAVPGASGSGTLATIQFTGLAAGTSALSLSNVLLLNSQLGVIEASVTNTELVVVAGSAVPEPTTLLLLAAGLAARCLRRRAGSAS